jgi:hypothetical protein
MDRIVALGNDEYHVEVVPSAEGRLQLFTMGPDETQVHPIGVEQIPALLNGDGDLQATAVTFLSSPQAGDPSGTSSVFTLELPQQLRGRSLKLTVPQLAIEGKRFRFSCEIGSTHEPSMPAKVTNDEERRLYLTPGGLYTEADVEANGRQTASQKFHGFTARHDLHPQAGERLCPITLTKANPGCTWIVAGKRDDFCCPPCVDEFVRLAKENPEQIKPPESYVQGQRLAPDIPGSPSRKE